MIEVRTVALPGLQLVAQGAADGVARLERAHERLDAKIDQVLLRLGAAAPNPDASGALATLRLDLEREKTESMRHWLRHLGKVALGACLGAAGAVLVWLLSHAKW